MFQLIDRGIKRGVRDHTLRDVTGWSKPRRVVVLRRRVHKQLCALTENPETKQLSFDFGELDDGTMRIYEYAVLVTSLMDEVLTIAQHYRDRADSENIFDELKNQFNSAHGRVSLQLVELVCSAS